HGRINHRIDVRPLHEHQRMRLHVAIVLVDRIIWIAGKEYGEIAFHIFVPLPLIRLSEKWNRGQNQHPGAYKHSAHRFASPKKLLEVTMRFSHDSAAQTTANPVTRVLSLHVTTADFTNHLTAAKGGKSRTVRSSQPIKSAVTSSRFVSLNSSWRASG